MKNLKIDLKIKKLYSVKLFEKEFILYFDDYKNYYNTYNSFFKYLSSLKAKNGGRKILLTSEFIDYDIKNFETAINDSGIEYIFSVGKFDQYIQELDNKKAWYMHCKTTKKIKDYLLEFIGSDDIVCIKGLEEYRFEKILDYIKSFSGSKIEQLNEKKDLPLGKKLEINDIKIYKEYLQQSRNIHWGYYFPFLIFFAKSTKRDFYVEEFENSLVLYMVSNGIKQHLFFYFPPMPMDIDSLKNIKLKLKDKLGVNKTNIMWIDQKDKELLDSFYEISKKQDEFIYNYDHIKDLKGSKLKNLRYNLKRFEKYDYEIRDYSIRDYFSCVSLLNSWEKDQKEKYEKLYDEEYTKNCLRFANRFNKKDLLGKVILVDGKIKAFGFAGQMCENIANIFIVKADPSIKGLSYFIKFELLKLLKDYDIVNDSCSLKNEGLKKAKESFDPIKIHSVYMGKDLV